MRFGGSFGARALALTALTLAVLAGSIPLVAQPALAADVATTPTPPPVYPLVFPVAGEDRRYADDAYIGFGACRDGCARLHQGIDIFAPKMTEVYAVADATVGWIGPSYCCSVFLIHDDGWQSWYIHLNNDTPGTDDDLGWGIAPGIVAGARVTAGQVIGYVGDSGNAKGTSPHLHFELHAPGGAAVDPYDSLRASQGQEQPACLAGSTAPLAALLTSSQALRKGNSGASVYELQGFLALSGYQVGAVDGVFGTATFKALKSFQSRSHLRADGVAGPTTLAAIRSAASQPAFSSLANPDGRLLVKGARGTDVRELQRWLKAAGYYPGRIDNVYGSATDNAVRAFQQARGIGQIDGKVGAGTRAALAAALRLTWPGTCS
jgi:peptidoglycan hydrolase-like protein with peptidoglycan-binding domain